MAKHSIPHFLISFLLSLCFAYIIIGFLNPVLDSILAIVIATLIVMTIANVLMYMSLRATPLWRSNLLATSLPIFFIGTIYICLQFPEMFVWEHISIPQQYLLTFILTALVSTLWSQAACRLI
ncbi:MAG: hypothetical protein JNM46_10605, partial [Anaerolineales bacterium]|nr:hypothetical protein [Anaerolineales bacterium]